MILFLFSRTRRTRPRGVNISAELQDEALPEEATGERSEIYPAGDQSGSTAPTTTLPSAPGTPSAEGASSGTTTALENGPRVEAHRPNASAHNQVNPIS